MKKKSGWFFVCGMLLISLLGAALISVIVHHSRGLGQSLATTLGALTFFGLALGFYLLHVAYELSGDEGEEKGKEKGKKAWMGQLISDWERRQHLKDWFFPFVDGRITCDKIRVIPLDEGITRDKKALYMRFSKRRFFFELTQIDDNLLEGNLSEIWISPDGRFLQEDPTKKSAEISVKNPV